MTPAQPVGLVGKEPCKQPVSLLKNVWSGVLENTGVVEARRHRNMGHSVPVALS